jgi:hypothetical protein
MKEEVLNTKINTENLEKQLNINKNLEQNLLNQEINIKKLTEQ